MMASTVYIVVNMVVMVAQCAFQAEVVSNVWGDDRNKQQETYVNSPMVSYK